MERSRAPERVQLLVSLLCPTGALLLSDTLQNLKEGMVALTNGALCLKTSLKYSVLISI